MDKISVKINFLLENGYTTDIVIRDLIPTASEAEITAVANALIENRAHSKGSLFKEVKKITKITTIEEVF